MYTYIHNLQYVFPEQKLTAISKLFPLKDNSGFFFLEWITACYQVNNYRKTYEDQLP